MSKKIIYDGKSFYKNRNGSYVSWDGINLHAHIYKSHNGDVPYGFIVYHKDKNKENNDPSNLGIITRGNYAKLYKIDKPMPDKGKGKPKEINVEKISTKKNNSPKIKLKEQSIKQNVNKEKYDEDIDIDMIFDQIKEEIL